jgi:HEPN domain-containing protein
MKTSVEWLQEQLECFGNKHELQVSWATVDELLEQAKEMEKEQIKDAFVECWKSNVPDGIECKLDAEQYYSQTFKSE